MSRRSHVVASCATLVIIFVVAGACPGTGDAPTRPSDAPTAVGGVVERITRTSNGYPQLIIKLADGRAYPVTYTSRLPARCVVGASWPECEG